MKRTILIVLFSSASMTLLAQGPPPMGGPGFGPRGGRGFGMGFGPGRAVVTGHPYSGTETTTTVQALASGNTITHVNTATVYRDSEGRTRIETTITPPPGSSRSAFTEIVIVDPVAGYRYVLNSSTMTAYQSPLPPRRASNTSGASTSSTGASAAVEPRRERAGVTTARTELGSTMVNGVSATGRQDVETIAAGAIGNASPLTVARTSYMSSDLEIPVQIKTSDPRFGTSDFELTNISTAEPSAALFTVPSNYTIKTGGPGGFGRGRGGSPAFRGPRQQ